MRSFWDSALWGSVGLLIILGGLWIRPVVVGGGSMEPALVRGDVCVAVSGLPVRRGDVVLFSDRGSLVLHRVIRISPLGELVTKGDANPVQDRRPVQPSRVQGRVAATVPFGAWARRWMLSARGDKLLNQSHSEAMTERRSGSNPAKQEEAPLTERASGGN